MEQTDEQVFKNKLLDDREKLKDPETKEANLDLMIGKDGLRRYHDKIVEILREWMDLDERTYSLIALWIVGTYLHKQFNTYAYLFLNAMKGSGKTRLLKIIANLSKDGELAGAMTEAVLFRTSQDTLCIDEIENINRQGQENLSLLLNSGYKRGLKVKRMRKDKLEGQIVEEFSVSLNLILTLAFLSFFPSMLNSSTFHLNL